MLFRKGLEIAELLTKTSFFLRNRPKDSKGNKQETSKKYEQE